MLSELFSYKSLVKKLSEGESWLERDFVVSLSSSAPFYFTIRPKHEQLLSGWEVHISVELSDLPKAWDSICDNIIKTKIGMVKLFNKNKDVIISGHHAPIIIYHTEYGSSLSGLLLEIERILSKAKIRPCRIISQNTPIKGSVYISYRNDAASKSPMWVSDDPFSGLDFSSIDHQCSVGRNIPEWMKKTLRVAGFISREESPKPQMQVRTDEFRKAISGAGNWKHVFTEEGEAIATCVSSLPPDKCRALIAALSELHFNFKEYHNDEDDQDYIIVLGKPSIRQVEYLLGEIKPPGEESEKRSQF